MLALQYMRRTYSALCSEFFANSLASKAYSPVLGSLHMGRSYQLRGQVGPLGGPDTASPLPSAVQVPGSVILPCLFKAITNLPEIVDRSAIVLVLRASSSHWLWWVLATRYRIVWYDRRQKAPS